MSIIEFIRDRARYYNCPVCGRNLRGCDVRMLDRVEERFTIQVTCASCHVTFIMILAIQGAGMEALDDLRIEIDVEQDEMEMISAEAGERGVDSGLGPIELDELLDLHLLLKDFRGRFSDLLKQRERA